MMDPAASLAASEAASKIEAAVEPLAWAVLPRRRKPPPEGSFIAQVAGRSMEPDIPDGAWCLFRAPVVDAPEGRVVLVQHRDLTDPETGGAYAVKRFAGVAPD